MKKFLAILLIAIVACSNVSVVEEEEFDLEKITGTVKEVVAWLKKNGLWDPLMNTLKTAGKVAAFAFCTRYAPANVCSLILNL